MSFNGSLELFSFLEFVKFYFPFNLLEQFLFIFLEQRVAEDTFGMFFPGLVEAVHVELSNETVDLVVPEVFGKHNLLKLVDVLDDEFSACARPVNNP